LNKNQPNGDDANEQANIINSIQPDNDSVSSGHSTHSHPIPNLIPDLTPEVDTNDITVTPASPQVPHQSLQSNIKRTAAKRQPSWNLMSANKRTPSSPNFIQPLDFLENSFSGVYSCNS